MKKYIGQLIRLKFKDMKPIDGIVMDYNDDWTLMQSNPADYVTDGYAIVRNKNIKEFQRGDGEKWREKIIKLKGQGKPGKVKVPLDNLEKILKSLTKKFGIFTLYTKEDDICWLGRLKSIDDKTLTIDDFTTKGKWSGQEDFKINDIRVIEFDTDYINSLKLISKEKSRTKTGSR
jgi:hypothetical protein